MCKKTIVIAEDHTLFRDGLSSLISSRSDLQVVGEAGNGLDAIRLVQEKKPDLLLLDLSMPQLGGIEVLKQTKHISPATKVLVVSMHSTESYLRGALKAGADGYLLKMADRNEFQVAIQAILSGKSYISSEFTSHVLDAYRLQDDPEYSSLDILSAREREVLILVAEGKTNREVADLLCISPKTADNHRTSIMRKLDLHRAIDLSNYARRQGLLADK